jgi:regulator of RNase E activity RraA
LLDVYKHRPQQNEHLANPLNRDPNVYYFRPRLKPLTGDEPVLGQFLSLKYCGHDPFVVLEDYDNIASLESSILSACGILNPFKTYELAFVDFRVAPYRITYCDRNGLVKVFDKQDQYVAKASSREEYPERKLEWIGS